VTLAVGDRVEQQARSTARAGRAGEIKEIVHADPTPRYRIRWDDGRESVYAPTDGCLKRVGRRKAARAPRR
jgi:Domain of unknown function (DUF1918)